jgi:hypothetical protein
VLLFSELLLFNMTITYIVLGGGIEHMDVALYHKSNCIPTRLYKGHDMGFTSERVCCCFI